MKNKMEVSFNRHWIDTKKLKEKTRPCTTVRNSDDKAIPLRWAHTQICILSTTAASFDQ